MKTTCLILGALAAAAFVLPVTVKAGEMGYSRAHSSGCAESKWETPRLNQRMPFRHFDRHNGDRRRYNAAPCCGEIVYTQPYVVKTVVVRKSYEPYYTYDSCGKRSCHRVYTVVYKDIYSDGSCHVWYSRA